MRLCVVCGFSFIFWRIKGPKWPENCVRIVNWWLCSFNRILIDKFREIRIGSIYLTIYCILEFSLFINDFWNCEIESFGYLLYVNQTDGWNFCSVDGWLKGLTAPAHTVKGLNKWSFDHSGNTVVSLSSFMTGITAKEKKRSLFSIKHFFRFLMNDQNVSMKRRNVTHSVQSFTLMVKMAWRRYGETEIKLFYVKQIPGDDESAKLNQRNFFSWKK